MKEFKIKIKELIIIIILASPISIFLFTHNYNKILVEYNISRGYGYINSICEIYPNTFKVELLSDSDIQIIINSHFSSLTNLEFKFLRFDSQYQIMIKGVRDQLIGIQKKLPEIKMDIMKLESGKFNELLGNINLQCGSSSSKAYKYIPPDSKIIQENIKKRYKNTHLFFLVTCPFIIIYLLIITLNYLKFKLPNKEQN